MGDYVVYVHQNKINGKRYVGITNNTTKRWYGKGKHYRDCTRFAAALNKYGWDNFAHIIIEKGLTLKEAGDLEKKYIREYRTIEKDYGYNIAPVGQSTPSMLGRHHSEATKEKMRKKALGRVISCEQKRKHSETMKGKMVGSKNPKSTAVRCVNTGEVFETQRAAAKAKGVLQSKISKCCSGAAKHTHGLRFEYAGETGA